MLIEPADGHFNQLSFIMKELIARNNEVVCVAGRRFKDKVQEIGATFHPFPSKWDPIDKELYDFFPALKAKKGIDQVKYYFKHIMFDSAPDVLKTLKNVLKTFKADVIINDSFLVAGDWLSELEGIPNIQISTLPLGIPGKNMAPFGFGLLPGKTFLTKLRNNILSKIFDRIVLKEIHEYVNKTRVKVGLPIFNKSFLRQGLKVPDLILQMSIPDVEYRRKDLPSNLKFIGTAKIPPKHDYVEPYWWRSIIHNDRPVVLVNQGTVAKNYDDLIYPAIEALKDENVIVILLVPVENGNIDNLPEHIYVEPYIPFGNLFPHIDIMITNGGFGGTQNALAHGIPVIISGDTEDKMEVGSRVQYSGAGINIGTGKKTVKNIKKAVRTILSDSSFKQKAEELQTEFAKYNPSALTIKLLDELVKSN